MGDNINVLALMPIVSADMMQYSIVYRAATLEIISTAMDTTGYSAASRQRRLKAAEFGTLMSSRIGIDL